MSPSGSPFYILDWTSSSVANQTYYISLNKSKEKKVEEYHGPPGDPMINFSHLGLATKVAGVAVCDSHCSEAVSVFAQIRLPGCFPMGSPRRSRPE